MEIIQVNILFINFNNKIVNKIIKSNKMFEFNHVNEKNIMDTYYASIYFVYIYFYVFVEIHYKKTF